MASSARSNSPLSAALEPALEQAQAAVKAQAERARGAAAAAPRPLPGSPSWDPAVFLGRRMELRAGIGLATLLETLESEQAVVEVTDPAAGAHLEDLYARGLADLRGIADRAFNSALPPHHRALLNGPKALAELLKDAGVLGGAEGTTPGPRAIRDAIEAIHGPFVDLLDRALERVRSESLALRAALTEALRALGPAATRIEKLDAALAHATEKDTSSLLSGLTKIGAEASEQVLRPAVEDLSPSASAEDLAAWFEPRGPLPQAVLALRRVLVGVLDFERRRLEALVHACRSAC